jgi:hypothetical protein
MNSRQPKQRPIALAGSLVFALAAPGMLILSNETGPIIALGPSGAPVRVAMAGRKPLEE